MRAVTLDDVLACLPAAAAPRVLDILQDETQDKAKRLRAVLCLHRETLEANGMVPEYLSYALSYAMCGVAMV